MDQLLDHIVQSIFASLHITIITILLVISTCAVYSVQSSVNSNLLQGEKYASICLVIPTYIGLMKKVKEKTGTVMVSL